MKIEIEKVNTDAQIKHVADIAYEVWHETYDPILPLGQTDYMIEKFQSVNAVNRQLESEGYIYALISFDGKPGGFVGFVPSYEDPSEMFLSKVYLLNEVRGNGGVAAAFDFVENEVRERGLSYIRLTVNKNNKHAIDVYKHYGFIIDSSVVNDIGEGYVMDDYVMIKRL